MQNIVFYRKYRPKVFSDVLGQEHIVSVLENAIKQSSVAHAYLFEGPRGTGKTSVARILATEVGVTNNDLHEIDAASNRGIDDIRQLRESVQNLPFESEQKIYIIDEVHMLTKEAFNALLKTLEEPPRHVIFILATTELSKIPETIVSRCQVFHFKKPTLAILKKTVLSISKKEGLSIDLSTAELIAFLGDGSFRDTLGVLQKITISANKKKITSKEVEKITGIPKNVLVNKAIRGLVFCEGNTALDAVNEADKEGVEIKIFLNLILQKLRIILLIRFGSNLESIAKEQITDEDFMFLKEISQDGNIKLNSGTIKTLLEAYDNMRYSSISTLPLELAIMEIVEKQKQDCQKHAS